MTSPAIQYAPSSGSGLALSMIAFGLDSTLDTTAFDFHIPSDPTKDLYIHSIYGYHRGTYTGIAPPADVSAYELDFMCAGDYVATIGVPLSDAANDTVLTTIALVVDVLFPVGTDLVLQWASGGLAPITFATVTGSITITYAEV